MVVSYPQYDKNNVLTPSRKELGKSLARKSRRTFSFHAVQRSFAKSEILKQFKIMLRDEMKSLLSEPTLVGNRFDLSSMVSYDWDDVYTALQRKAPVLAQFLNTCLPRQSKRRHTVLVMCIALLIYSHRRCTIGQTIISVILFTGHAGKQVIFEVFQVYVEMINSPF